MRFSKVSLRNGLGCITPEGHVHSPPDEGTFTLASAGDAATPYYVADIGVPVAILTGRAELGVELSPREAIKIAKHLVAAGSAVVVWREHGLKENALRCFSKQPLAHARAAAAIWVLRTRGGWEELTSEAMEVSQITDSQEDPSGTDIDSVTVRVSEPELGQIETNLPQNP